MRRGERRHEQNHACRTNWVTTAGMATRRSTGAGKAGHHSTGSTGPEVDSGVLGAAMTAVVETDLSTGHSVVRGGDMDCRSCPLLDDIPLRSEACLLTGFCL